jgi:hypothetical protein
MKPGMVGLAAALWMLTASAAPDTDAPKPEAHESRNIAGWTVRVDARLLEAPNDVLGQRSLALLEDHLHRISDVVPQDKLEKLRAVAIQLDLTHGSLHSMQYHPSADWLKEHGFAEDLAKRVHIPDATRFADPLHQHTQPWCVLHELAHSYHDQILGFEEPRLKAAQARFKASGHGDNVLHVSGRRQKHYALTNPMEFFAEMSECYFGTNDFFPFVNGELKEAEPEIHALLREIWGAPAWEPAAKPKS